MLTLDMNSELGFVFALWHTLGEPCRHVAVARGAVAAAHVASRRGALVPAALGVVARRPRPADRGQRPRARTAPRAHRPAGR